MNGQEQMFWNYAIFIILIFIAGIYYLIATTNLIRALIGVEILIKAATVLIILAGNIINATELAQTIVITLIVIEVVVMVVGGGVVLCIYRNNNSIDSRLLNKLKE